MGNLLSRITDCQRHMKTMFDVFEGTTPKVLILGLDGAGKTSFLYSSKLDDFIYAIAPPNGVIIEHVTPKRGARIQLLDMPGSKLTRHLWHNWFPKTEAIIFVVDSADKVRIDEAKFELHDLLTSRWLRKVPLIVVANKQDLPESMAEDEVAKELDLPSISNRNWSIYGVSTTKKKSVMHIFEDAVEKIKAYRHYKNSLIEKSSTKNNFNKDKKEEEIKKSGGPVFTSIEDCDAMSEKIPSLFANINKKSDETKDVIDEGGDSGLSSHGSVTYDQINEADSITDFTQNEKPDSLSGTKSVDSRNNTFDGLEAEKIKATEELQPGSSQEPNSETSCDLKVNDDNRTCILDKDSSADVEDTKESSDCMVNIGEQVKDLAESAKEDDTDISETMTSETQKIASDSIVNKTDQQHKESERKSSTVKIDTNAKEALITHGTEPMKEKEMVTYFNLMKDADGFGVSVDKKGFDRTDMVTDLDSITDDEADDSEDIGSVQERAETNAVV